MSKAIAALAVLLLSALYAAPSVGHSTQSALVDECATMTVVDQVETLQTASDSDAVTLGISNEEAARREKVCDKLRDNCLERCLNWKLKGKKLRDCRDTCNANWDDCIADIK